MRKIQAVLVSLLVVCLLAGCGDATANVSNGKSVLIEIGKTKVTKGDLYEQMIAYDKADYIIKNAAKQVVNLEIETTDEIQTKADEQYASILATYGDLETVYKQLGYKNEDELKEDILASIKSEELANVYFEENIDDLFTKYTPMKIRVMVFSSSDDAEGTENTYTVRATSALKEIKAGGKFETIAAKYCSKDDVKLADETLYTTEATTYDKSVTDFLATVTSPTLSDVITGSDGTSSYIVQVTVSNHEQLKAEFQTNLSSSTTFTELVYGHYLKKHNFTVYDIDIYNIIKTNYPAYIGE